MTTLCETTIQMLQSLELAIFYTVLIVSTHTTCLQKKRSSLCQQPFANNPFPFAGHYHFFGALLAYHSRRYRTSLYIHVALLVHGSSLHNSMKESLVVKSDVSERVVTPPLTCAILPQICLVISIKLYCVVHT